jgi:pimeloyl-ACP methyl ester carboxylesterase
MLEKLRKWMAGLNQPTYRRLPPLILINGLAEQPESWLCNRAAWSRHFDVKVPEILVYDGPRVRERIEQGLPITVEYLTDQLESYLDNFVQARPYHLVASSLGCQVAIEYAVRRPDDVGRMVLLCPSGVGGEERLPVVEGVRHNDFDALIGSVFHSHRFVDPAMVRHYERLFANKTWRRGLLRTVRGTSHHNVRDKLPLVTRPTLLICGAEDRIVDPEEARTAVRDLPNIRFVMLRNCGHAPQIEKSRRINAMVLDFLQQPGLEATVTERESLAPRPTYV